MKKKLLALCLASTLILSACAGTSANSTVEINSISSDASEEAEHNNEEANSVSTANDPIKISDIDLTVESRIDDYGDRSIMCQYTNNSTYSILGVEIKYTQKESVTDDDRAVLSDLKDTYGYTDDELNDLYMRAHIEYFTYPGESSTAQYVKLDDYVARIPSSIEQFDLMEPDIASIAFLDSNNSLRIEYYDFKTDDYSLSTKSQDNLYQAPKKGMQQYFIDIETPFLQSGSDNESRYHGTAYHISKNDYSIYKEKWVDAGYTNIDREHDDAYKASNNDNVEVYLKWDALTNSLSIEIELEDED